MKKILVIDDSALMRRIFCDILNGDGRFEVAGMARDGREALNLLEANTFDALILDINMPKMNGIEFLEELQKRRKREKVIVASTDTADGADVTIKALELGAFDFIQKPKNTLDARQGEFKERFLDIVEAATETAASKVRVVSTPKEKKLDDKLLSLVTKKSDGKRKLVAIACSTGGPNALQHVIPYLPANLAAPVLVVQHMPAGFTKSLAERLDSLSAVSVKEAEENDVPIKGHVYLARGGSHMKYDDKHGKIYYSDEPAREGVKPSANYMYESLIDSGFDEIVCVVLTGMGQDGTVGIKNLRDRNNLHIIAQDEASSTVFGMPRAIINSGVANQVVALDNVAQEIVMRIGIN